MIHLVATFTLLPSLLFSSIRGWWSGYVPRLAIRYELLTGKFLAPNKNPTDWFLAWLDRLENWNKKIEPFISRNVDYFFITIILYQILGSQSSPFILSIEAFVRICLISWIIDSTKTWKLHKGIFVFSESFSGFFEASNLSSCLRSFLRVRFIGTNNLIIQFRLSVSDFFFVSLRGSSKLFFFLSVFRIMFLELFFHHIAANGNTRKKCRWFNNFDFSLELLCASRNSSEAESSAFLRLRCWIRLLI